MTDKKDDSLIWGPFKALLCGDTIPNIIPEPGQFFEANAEKDGNEIIDVVIVRADSMDTLSAMLMMQATARLKRIREMERELKVQQGVNELAYIPHRHLVEENDKLRSKITEDTKRLDWAERNPEAFRHAMSVDWANAGSGFREVQFNWRGTIDHAMSKVKV
jgi:hypothetical protein